MTRNKQLERDQVLKPCLNTCDNLLIQGIILQYRRLDALDKDHKPGSPDIEIHLIKDHLLWVLMIECKKPDGGIQSPNQIKYMHRYSGLNNVMYRIVRSQNELLDIVEEITGFYKNLFNGMHIS